MTANPVAVSPGIAQIYDLQEIVEKELRGQALKDERALLEQHPDQWRNHLIFLKRRTEVQFSSSKARKAKARNDYQIVKETGNDHQISMALLTYQEVEIREADWRAKANFFLSAIEDRLTKLKHHGD